MKESAISDEECSRQRESKYKCPEVRVCKEAGVLGAEWTRGTVVGDERGEESED